MVVAAELKKLFIEAFSKESTFKCENGNPFLMKLNGKRYYVFLKNLSPAYFRNSPDIVRVQLPFSEKFQQIAKSTLPLIVLGFDDKNDMFTNWSPVLIKSRLNNRSNVSLYSRKEFRNKALTATIGKGVLMTGEQVVTFRRKNIGKFFLSLDSIFDSALVKEQSDTIKATKNNDGTIYEISDKVILRQLLPLIKKNRLLEAVQLSAKLHGKQYSQMTFSDWFLVVQKLHSKNAIS